MKVPILLPNIFDHPFTYESGNINLKLGDYVLIPFGKSKVMPSIQSLLNNTSENFKLDYFLPHQGSKLIVETIRETLNVSKKLCPFTAEKSGLFPSSSAGTVIPLVEKDIVMLSSNAFKAAC